MGMDFPKKVYIHLFFQISLLISDSVLIISHALYPLQNSIKMSKIDKENVCVCVCVCERERERER